MAKSTAKKPQYNPPKKKHADKRTVFIRVVASVCALLMIGSALAVIFTIH